MSLAGARQEIATALSTVDGVTGHVLRPTLLKTGVGWPSWVGASRAAAYSFMHVWKATIIVPSGEAAANQWLDDHVADLVDALMPVGMIDEYDPTAVPTTSGDLFAVTFTLRKE